MCLLLGIWFWPGPWELVMPGPCQLSLVHVVLQPSHGEAVGPLPWAGGEAGCKV